MKIKNTYEGAPINPAVAAEIEALYQEVATLKNHIKDLVNVTNANREVLHDLLEVLKGAAIPYRK
jgi:predicted CoA-binding protein